MYIVQMEYKAKDRTDYKRIGTREFKDVKPDDMIIETCWSAVVKGTDRNIPIDDAFEETSIKDQDETLGIRLSEVLARSKMTRTVIEVIGIEKYKNKDVTNPTFQKHAAILPSLIAFQQITAPTVARTLGIQKLQARNIIEELEKAGILKRTYTFWTMTKHVRSQIRDHLMGENIPVLAPKQVPGVMSTEKKPRYGKLEQVYQQRVEIAEMKWRDKHSHFDKKKGELVEDYEEDELIEYHNKIVIFLEKVQEAINEAGYKGLSYEKQKKIDVKMMKDMPRE